MLGYKIFFSWMKILNILMFSSSIFLIFNSNSWIMIWLFLEINLMMFMFLIKNNNLLTLNSMMKYFIIQAFASSVILMSVILMKSIFILEFWNIIMFLAFWLKLGLPPFSSWFMMVNEKLDITSFFYLNMFQKISPFYLMSLNFNFLIIFLFLIISISLSTIDMFNQTSLRWIISCSSINHFSWMSLSILNFNFYWFYYLMIYIFLMFMMFLKFKNLTPNSFSNFFNFFKKSSFSISIMMFSFSGMPPLLGFLPKILILFNNNYLFLMILFLFFSLISSFIYLRLIIPNLIFLKLKKKYFYKENFIMVLTLNLIPFLFFIFFSYIN